MTLYWFAMLLTTALAPAQVTSTQAADTPAFTRTEDVIYGRKYGTALTMDLFTPAKPNNAAVIWVVSGGWFSAHEGIQPAAYAEFLRRGYTVFAVVHGSQPKYTIPEVIEDLHRAVRFIRDNADRFDVDPGRFGIAGGSAGGHLSLMIATAGQPGDLDAPNPLNRVSSRVQAVACFYPPTDFLNYGSPGRDVFQVLKEELRPFQAPFDFHRLDPESKRFLPITNQDERLEIARQISPITHVSPDDPPTLIIHGDADKLVPIQQSEELINRLKQAGVTARLEVRPGAKHGWPDLRKDIATFADWFDTYLLGKPTTTTRPD